ncbi:MAG: glutamate-5-semialdehyde dehydrogenase [Chitinophagaceae bacterium]
MESTFASAKEASRKLGRISAGKISFVLHELAAEIVSQAEYIIRENAIDLEKMAVGDYRYDRLLLNEERIKGMASEVKRVADLPVPVGKILSSETLENGLKISKIVVPIGVIGIIYEARPNVSCDAFVLCFKTSNACILKGGSDAHHSNLAIIGLIRSLLQKNGIDPDTVNLLPAERRSGEILMQARGYVDVIIPRGSQQLINYVRENAKVPVIETGAGIVHTFFDESADLEKGAAIIMNAKTRRVSVCNALDCLLIHEKRLADLPELVRPLIGKNVEIAADEQSYQSLVGSYPSPLLQRATENDFGTEFLDYKLAIKTVSGLDEALEHINTFGSKHSEAILSQERKNIARFIETVDAAAVYSNTSTAFTDGAQFGLGAEIGISTQKLHARGPMGLEALTSYKWVVEGDGQVRK